MKRLARIAVNIISGLIIAASIFILISVLLTRGSGAPQVLGYSVFNVVTGSMEPAIKQNDMLLVKHSDPKSINKGDIISFYAYGGELKGSVNTHRVVDIVEEGGKIAFITKGDANETEDASPVTGEALIGKVVWSSAFLGKLFRISSNPLVFLLLIAAPLLLLLTINLIRAFKLARRSIEIEEEEKQAGQKEDNAEDKRP